MRRGSSGLTPTHFGFFFKPALVWSWYQDANPVSTSPLADYTGTAPSGPIQCRGMSSINTSRLRHIKSEWERDVAQR